MKNKILSIVLCLAMLISCLSAYAYAATIEVEIDLGGLFDDEPTDTPPATPDKPDAPSGDDDKDDGKGSNKGNGGNGTGSTSPKDDETEETVKPYEDVDLSAVAESLYEGIDKEDLPMLATISLTEEDFEFFTFVPYDESYEAVANEPMMGSIAHSVVLVKCESAEEAEKLAEEMKKNQN